MAAFQDLESLARDFAADIRKVAWESEALGGDVLNSLRGILQDTLDRIKTEVFTPPPGPSSKETGEKDDTSGPHGGNDGQGGRSGGADAAGGA